MNTKKHLLAYQISGQTVGVDIGTWNQDDLNGNPPFKIILSGDTVPSGYTEIDTIENWDSFALNIANDYSVVKFQIKEMCEIIGWTGLTNTEKDLAIKYFSYGNVMDCIIYLMTVKGMSQAQAQGYVLREWHRHHLKNIKAYTSRWNYAKFTVLMYISRADGEDLFNTVKNLVDLYIEVGILGIDYNDNQDGLDDYVWSKNGFTGQGLEENGYALLQGTWQDFKEALTKVLICGIYDKYDDIEADIV